MKTYPTPPCFAPRADTNNLIIEGMLYSTDTFKEGIHNYTVSLWSIFGPLQEFQDKYHFKYFKNITLEEGGEIIYNSLLPKSELYVSNCVNPTGKSISVVEEALQAWSNIANISFVLDEKESILNFYICKTERDELNDLIFYQNNSPLSGATLFFSSSEIINTANIYIQPYPPLK